MWTCTHTTPASTINKAPAAKNVPTHLQVPQWPSYYRKKSLLYDWPELGVGKNIPLYTHTHVRACTCMGHLLTQPLSLQDAEE